MGTIHFYQETCSVVPMDWAVERDYSEVVASWRCANMLGGNIDGNTLNHNFYGVAESSLEEVVME